MNLQIAIIGFGYWGPNLVRNFISLENVKVEWIVELKEERLKTVHKNYPSIKTSNDVETVLEDPSVDAVVIATPVSSHFSLAQKALLAGKHVLVEKPFTVNSFEAESL